VTTINSFDYTYDRVGNRTSKTSRDGIANYTYDTLNRLLQAVNPLPTNPLESFTYDAVGNRTTSNQNGASTFNAANQLTEDSNFTYQYDNNGNLTRKTPKVSGPFTSYEYDAENKLVRVVTNGTTINYRYDGLGRRVEKEVINVTTNVTRYIYDNEDILLELDGSNNITARYTHGPGIDEPLILEKAGQSFFYHADGLGSITEITDSAGVVKQRYTYSSFGKIESQLDPSFVQPYTFTAREFDPETDTYHYRQRQYDWRAGRFNSVDPIGFAGGINLYVAMRNNPVNSTDPFGDQPQPAPTPQQLGAPPVAGVPAGVPGSSVQPSVPNPAAIINMGNQFLLLQLMRQLSREIEAKVAALGLTIDCGKEENFKVCFSTSHPLGSVVVVREIIFASGQLTCFNRVILGRKRCCPLSLP